MISDISAILSDKHLTDFISLMSRSLRIYSDATNFIKLWNVPNSDERTKLVNYLSQMKNGSNNIASIIEVNDIIETANVSYGLTIQDNEYVRYDNFSKLANNVLNLHLFLINVIKATTPTPTPTITASNKVVLKIDDIRDLNSQINIAKIKLNHLNNVIPRLGNQQLNNDLYVINAAKYIADEFSNAAIASTEIMIDPDRLGKIINWTNAVTALEFNMNKTLSPSSGKNIPIIAVAIFVPVVLLIIYGLFRR